MISPTSEEDFDTDSSGFFVRGDYILHYLLKSFVYKNAKKIVAKNIENFIIYSEKLSPSMTCTTKIQNLLHVRTCVKKKAPYFSIPISERTCLHKGRLYCGARLYSEPFCNIKGVVQNGCTN